MLLTRGRVHRGSDSRKGLDSRKGGREGKDDLGYTLVLLPTPGQLLEVIASIIVQMLATKAIVAHSLGVAPTVLQSLETARHSGLCGDPPTLDYQTAGFGEDCSRSPAAGWCVGDT